MKYHWWSYCHCSQWFRLPVSFAQASSRNTPSRCPSYVLGCYSVSGLKEERDTKHGSVSVIQHDIFGGIDRVHYSKCFAGLVLFLKLIGFWVSDELSSVLSNILQIQSPAATPAAQDLFDSLHCRHCIHSTKSNTSWNCMFKTRTINVFQLSSTGTAHWIGRLAHETWPHSGLRFVVHHSLLPLRLQGAAHGLEQLLGLVACSQIQTLSAGGLRELGVLGMVFPRGSGFWQVCPPIWVELGFAKENIASDWNKTNRLHVRTTSTTRGFYGVAWKKTL